MNLPCVHVTHIRRSRKRYHQMISIALLIFKHTSFGIRCLSNVRERQVRNPLRNPAGPKFGEMMLPRHTCHEVSSWLFCRFTVVPPPPHQKKKMMALLLQHAEKLCLSISRVYMKLNSCIILFPISRFFTLVFLLFIYLLSLFFSFVYGVRMLDTTLWFGIFPVDCIYFNYLLLDVALYCFGGNTCFMPIFLASAMKNTSCFRYETVR